MRRVGDDGTDGGDSVAVTQHVGSRRGEEPNSVPNADVHTLHNHVGEEERSARIGLMQRDEGTDIGLRQLLNLRNAERRSAVMDETPMHPEIANSPQRPDSFGETDRAGDHRASGQLFCHARQQVHCLGRGAF